MKKSDINVPVLKAEKTLGHCWCLVRWGKSSQIQIQDLSLFLVTQFKQQEPDEGFSKVKLCHRR
jgi:hypothetical protein